MFGDEVAELLVRIGIQLTRKAKDKGFVSFFAAPPQGHGQTLQFSDWSSSPSSNGGSVGIPRRSGSKILDWIQNGHYHGSWVTSTALGHHGNETSKMVVRVVGAWTGFRVILDTEGRLLQKTQGRHRPIVEIVVGDPYLLRR